MTTYSTDAPRTRGDDDAPHLTPVTPAEDARTIMLNRISWGAVMAGVVVALVTQIVLNMLGVGIGAATLDPGTTDNPTAGAFSLGAGLWFLGAGLVAALLGGYAAGRLAGRPHPNTTGWHGLTAWALSTIVVIYLLTTTIGGLVGGTLRGVANAFSGTASTVVQAAAPAIGNVADPFAQIETSVRSATGGNDPAALRDAAVASVRAAITGNPQQAAEARERAAQALSRAQGIPIEEARTRVGEYEQQYRQTAEQARRRATEAADVAAQAVSRGALFASIALLLGALAAWFGGRMGAVEPTITSSALRGRETVVSNR